MTKLEKITFDLWWDCLVALSEESSIEKSIFSSSEEVKAIEEACVTGNFSEVLRLMEAPSSKPKPAELVEGLRKAMGLRHPDMPRRKKETAESALHWRGSGMKGSCRHAH